MNSFAQSSLIRILPDSGPAKRLCILLHGVGANAAGLEMLGRMMANAFPDAAIEIPDGFFPFDGGGMGRQWFSVRGVTEENRPQRVAQALPALVQWVIEAQQRNGVTPANTTLVGFSQGSIMSLELAAAYDGRVGRVVAFAGRFAALPTVAPKETRIHLLHGEHDAVMPVSLAHAAYERLTSLGGAATLDTEPGVGHSLSEFLVERAITHLKTE